MPRSIDRTLFAILAVLQLAEGVYFAGPWYLDSHLGAKAALFSMFDSAPAVILYGSLLFIDGLCLLYAAAGKRGRWYINIVSSSLLAGFLLRLYSIIGVLIALDSWRPPQYLSHIATVAIFGALWIYMRVSSREGTV